MRSLILSAAILAGSVVSAQAATVAENTGAGLGTVIFKDHDGLASHVLAATTNYILLNQSFAITFGTWGAEKPEGFFGAAAQVEFIENNMDVLALEIAAGKGETLDALCELMALEGDARVSAKSKLQANFSSIYANDEVTGLEVAQGIDRVIASS